MRKNRFWGSLLVILALMTVRCTSDLPEPDIPTSRTETVSIDEVPGLLEAIAPYVNPSFLDRGNISSANQGDTYFGMNIDFEHIMAQMDSMQYTNYSFLLDDGDGDKNTFANLVVGKDSIGQYHPPLLIQYEMSSEFAQQYFETGSFEGFTGHMTRAQLAIPTTSSQQNDRTSDSEDPGDYGSDRDQPSTTCPQTTPMSGGEPYTPSDPGGSTGTTTWEVCEVIVHTGTRILADGTYTTYWFTTYENCYTMEVPTLTSSDNDGTCSNPEGEVPINTPEPADEPCKTTKDDMKKVFPNTSDAELQKIVDAVNKYAEDFGIDSKEKLQHFLAQAGHESAKFTAFEEYKNFRVKNLSGIWPTKFNPYDDPTKDPNKQNPKDYEVSGSDFADVELLMNYVYADANRAKGYKMGNTSTGDGYKYRGRGIFQLTGKYSYNQFTTFYKKEYDSTKNFVDSPDLLKTDAEIAVVSALWFYQNNVLNVLSIDSTTTVEKVSEKINSGEDDYSKRKEIFNKAVENITCK